MLENEMKVTIRYRDIEAQFAGEPREVYMQVVKFMEKVIPTYTLASKIILEIGLEEIFEKLSDSIAYNSEEGIIFLKNLVDLPSQDAILFFALKNHIEHKIGRREDPAISIVDLSKNLQKKEKTISGRLSELINLKLSDIDSSLMIVRIKQSKGKKDRQVMLSS
ncbi:MAG: hypothetical protein QXE44_04960, partial [Nitrososphaerota archaeon]